MFQLDTPDERSTPNTPALRTRMLTTGPADCDTPCSNTTADRQTRQHTHKHTEGLSPPVLDAAKTQVTGRDKQSLQKLNKARRQAAQLVQPDRTIWTTSSGTVFLSQDRPARPTDKKQMHPSRLTATHLAGPFLEEWSAFSCPTMTGAPWTVLQMEQAIARGPHKSTLMAPALAHFAAEVREKVSAGQAHLVPWADIKDNPPAQLKISPIAAIPHNSKPYWSILDLSFSLRLADGSHVPSVNETTTKTAPAASTEQLGHSLA